MNLSLPLVSKEPPLPLQEVLGLYRRLCVLLRQGKANEAESLQIEQLTPALSRLEAAHAIETGQLEAQLAVEARRVEDAALVAELITPFLPAPPASAPTGMDRPVSSQVLRADSSARARPAADNVAAFIDDMLAQRPADRRR